jgi:threonine 3-dehydrogenase
VKALVKKDAAPGLWLADVPEPAAGPGDVLIKVLRTGICGTDLHIRAWDGWARQAVSAPLVLGHEFVGEVAGTGRDVTGIAVGDLVSGEGHLVCGTCRNCLAGRRHLCRSTIGLGVGRDGAFAEYVSLPASNVWVHRTEVDLDIAAIFDPFGNAVHTALSFPLVGEDVLITGAGPIGIMACAVARHAGARNVVITDVSAPRLELARKAGADLAVDVSRVSIAEAGAAIGLKEGFDVGLEMSGQAVALRDMLANMAHGGRIALLGIPPEEFAIDWNQVVFNMLTIKGIYGREMYETWYAMTVMVQSGLDISPVITHHFAHDEHEEAFATAAGGKAGKVILHWRD